MIIDGKEIELKVELKQLYQARRKGCDIGDLANGKLQAIAVNPLDAIHAAWLIYEKQLKAVGVKTFDAFIGCDAQELSNLVGQFREELGVFFPVIRAIMSEIETAMDEIVAPQASGPQSGGPLES
jgi:hypothetical protein